MRPLCFVLGAPRSGTTLLRVMMAGHPQLFSPPEMVIAPFTTMADRKRVLGERWWEKGGLRRAIVEFEHCDPEQAKAIEATLDDKTVPEVYDWLRERIGDKILVDKCPHLSAEPAALERLARWYPDARWVWIVRHPGSVVRSIQNMPMAEVLLRGYAGDPRDIWATCNKNIKRFFETLPAERKALVKYEDIVTDAAKQALTPVCEALGVPWDDALLTPYEGDRMREGPPGARAVGDPNLAGRGKIQPELATKWLEGFDPSSVGPDTHALARELGYDLGRIAPPPITRTSASITDLLDTVQRLERSIDVPSDVDAVEGRRFLMRQLAHSLDLFVENGDPDVPLLRHAEGPTRKQFADNPDTDYWRAPIGFQADSGRVYRVWGRVPAGTTYTGILLYRRGGQIGNRLRDVEYVRPDGTFDVSIAVNQPATTGTWLRADGDETAVMVRQYFSDRATEAPIEVHVELVGGPRAKVLDPEAITKGVERARRNLEATFERTLQTWKMASVGALNRCLPIGGEQLFPTPDNSYLACWWRIGPDQLLRVRGKLPKARYVSFCLYDLWMQSLDYERSQVALNQRTIVAPDGSYELVVGHRSNGATNWLDTGGRQSGYLLIRSLLPEGDVPTPTVDVLYEREFTPT